LIGVDVGTQGTKAVLVDAAGRVVAQHAQGYPLETPQQSWARQWPQVWLDACVACIRGVLARSGISPAAVQASGISSLGGGSGIPVDAAVRLPRLHQDDVAARPCARCVGTHALPAATQQLDQRAVVGGVSRSDLCMQIVADVCGRPVFTTGDEVEAPLGAAMLAALGTGMIDADGVRRGWADAVPRALPVAGRVDRYAALYDQYRATYPALKPLMHRLRELPPAP
jgi:sugar (pentulose or hexulose) kinase